MTSTKQVANAQRTRRQIARTFRLLNDERLNVTELLENSPRCLNRVRVFDVVRRLPHMGSDGAEKTLRKAKVWPLTRMRDLTDDDRAAIITALPPRAKGLT